MSEMVRRVALAICKSRTCEGASCCQWPANTGRTRCNAKQGAPRVNATMADRLASKPMKAAEIARDFGFTARYWIKQAASGKVPGAWQPSGPGGAWLFDHAEFVAWRKASKREVATCPRYTVEAKSIGRAPSVRVESSAEASRQRIDQLLRSVLGNGSTSSTRPPGGTSRGGRSARLPRNSSANT
jgi:hypothetical protein